MALESSYVFVWKDSERKVAYAGWGDALAPKLLWVEKDSYESELNSWLRTLDRPPDLAPESVRFAIFQNAARAAVRRITNRLRNEGWQVLSARDESTIDGGYKEDRPVYVQGPYGRQYFRSVRAAARALGVTPSAVTRLARSNNSRITYVDEADQP